MPNPAAPPKRKDRLAIAAAALAWAPIGFALGGLIAGRLFAAGALGGAGAPSGGTGASSGGIIAASALFGALVIAALMAGVATRLPAKPLRVTTVVAGGASFALIIFLVRNFVTDRMRQAEAFDAAYARMQPFELRVESSDPNRRPFSALTFDSTTRVYVAARPGGWLCRGNGRREHAFALGRALQLAKRQETAPETARGHCITHVSWRHGNAAAALVDDAMQDDATQEATKLEHRACAPEALLLAADAMVGGTARRASCRRPHSEAPD